MVNYGRAYKCSRCFLPKCVIQEIEDAKAAMKPDAERAIFSGTRSQGQRDGSTHSRAAIAARRTCTTRTPADHNLALPKETSPFFIVL